jgi:peptidoglycan/xylan/chitin deacetylase (PgdA/CDA1 family)
MWPRSRETRSVGRGPRSPAWRPVLVLALILSFAIGLVSGLGALVPRLKIGRGGGPGFVCARRAAEGLYLESAGQRVELGGISLYEIVGRLEELAPLFSRLPKDAYIDRETRGVVPDLDGWRLDVTATAESALSAQPDTEILAVYYPLAARLRLADFPNAPVYRGNGDRSEVAIILNVAWGDEFLDEICALVESSGGRLTICPVGQWLQAQGGRAAWLGEAVKRGHDVGNHGYANRPMIYDARRIRDELDSTATLIRAACGRDPAFFAPPMGAIDDRSVAAAATAGYRTVLWSLDTIDWRLEGADIIADRVISRVKAGDIILCHPTAQTAPAMERFLPALAAKGLRAVTLTQLLSPAGSGATSGP